MLVLPYIAPHPPSEYHSPTPLPALVRPGLCPPTRLPRRRQARASIPSAGTPTFPCRPALTCPRDLPLAVLQHHEGLQTTSGMFARFPLISTYLPAPPPPPFITAASAVTTVCAHSILMIILSDSTNSSQEPRTEIETVTNLARRRTVHRAQHHHTTVPTISHPPAPRRLPPHRPPQTS